MNWICLKRSQQLTPRAVWTLALIPASNFTIPTFGKKKKKQAKLARQVPRGSPTFEKVDTCIFAQRSFFFSSSFYFSSSRCTTRSRIHDVAAKVRGVRRSCAAHFGYYIRRNHPVYVYTHVTRASRRAI